MISAWSYGDVIVTSPDGKHVAKVIGLQEIAMGAPTSGKLMVDSTFVAGNFGPSCVWSECSNLLAIPIWIRKKVPYIAGATHPEMVTQTSTHIAIYDTVSKDLKISPVKFGVLELSTFENGTLSALINPLQNELCSDLNIETDLGIVL